MNSIITSIIRPSTLRWACAAVAIFATSGMTSHAATEEVTVKLGGKRFGHERSMKFKSGTRKTIFPSKIYKYEIKGAIRGKGGVLGEAFPQDIPLDTFLNSLKKGSSSLLSGSLANDSGKIPATLVNKSLKGKLKTKVGTWNVSLKLTAQIAKDGQLLMNITRVSITRNDAPMNGEIVFSKGSTLTVSTAPALTFKSAGQGVSEEAGIVKLIVSRLGNPKPATSVQFSTADGTALAGVDYQASTGIINFANGEKTKTIEIPIINREGAAKDRKFTITLSSPATGSVLGKNPTTTVLIRSL